MNIKFIIIGLAALFIVTAVGGTIWAFKAHVDGLNAKITKQQEQIAGLEIDKKKLEISNESLKKENDRKAEEAASIRKELETFRQVDAASKQRLLEVERKLRDYENVRQHEAIRESKKASLLLRLINLDIKCQVENFNRVDGKCIRGKFVVDGERLDNSATPEAKPEEAKNEK